MLMFIDANGYVYPYPYIPLSLYNVYNIPSSIHLLSKHAKEEEKENEKEATPTMESQPKPT